MRGCCLFNGHTFLGRTVFLRAADLPDHEIVPALEGAEGTITKWAAAGDKPDEPAFFAVTLCDEALRLRFLPCGVELEEEEVYAASGRSTIVGIIFGAVSRKLASFWTDDDSSV